jgi:carbamoyl-phosphate synthase large subunit
MKSVGEAMAIGRTFQESLQKALRSLETGLTGFDEIEIEGGEGDDKNASAPPWASRRRTPADRPGLRHGLTVEEIHAACKIDPWFLRQIREIVDTEARDPRARPADDAGRLRKLKAMGFSDARLAELTGLDEAEVARPRAALGVRPVFKRIDTCAAEFASPTAYMYSTYEARSPAMGRVRGESRPDDRKKVVILGGGPNRIGQGIEFDYCCCHACLRAARRGYETIMVNCNPETVSTDYDTSDRLYFEPLTPRTCSKSSTSSRPERHAARRHRAVRRPDAAEARQRAREAAGVPILGTTPDAIDLAEDRDRFQRCYKLGLKQPENGIAYRSRKPGRRRAKKHRLSGRHPPVLRAGRPRHGDRPRRREQLRTLHRAEAVRRLGREPLLIDRYLSDAIEVDVDASATARRLRRRHHGAHRGSRHPLRRQRLLAAALFARRPSHRRARSARPSWPWRSTSSA